MDESFWDVFERKLAIIVASEPSEYALRPDETPEAYARQTRVKMQAAGMSRCNHNGLTFRAVAKHFGVRPTRAGLLEAEANNP